MSVALKPISGTMSTILAINGINAANENSNNNNNVNNNNNNNENNDSRGLGQCPEVEGLAASALRFVERLKVMIHDKRLWRKFCFDREMPNS